MDDTEDSWIMNIMEEFNSLVDERFNDELTPVNHQPPPSVQYKIISDPPMPEDCTEEMCPEEQSAIPMYKKTMYKSSKTHNSNEFVRDQYPVAAEYDSYWSNDMSSKDEFYIPLESRSGNRRKSLCSRHFTLVDIRECNVDDWCSDDEVAVKPEYRSRSPTRSKSSSGEYSYEGLGRGVNLMSTIDEEGNCWLEGEALEPDYGSGWPTDGLFTERDSFQRPLGHERLSIATEYNGYEGAGDWRMVGYWWNDLEGNFGMTTMGTIGPNGVPYEGVMNWRIFGDWQNGLQENFDTMGNNGQNGDSYEGGGDLRMVGYWWIDPETNLEVPTMESTGRNGDPEVTEEVGEGYFNGVYMPSFEEVLTGSDDSQHTSAELERNTQHYSAECIEQYASVGTPSASIVDDMDDSWIMNIMEEFNSLVDESFNEELMPFNHQPPTSVEYKIISDPPTPEDCTEELCPEEQCAIPMDKKTIYKSFKTHNANEPNEFIRDRQPVAAGNDSYWSDDMSSVDELAIPLEYRSRNRRESPYSRHLTLVDIRKNEVEDWCSDDEAAVRSGNCWLEGEALEPDYGSGWPTDGLFTEHDSFQRLLGDERISIVTEYNEYEGVCNRGMVRDWGNNLQENFESLRMEASGRNGIPGFTGKVGEGFDDEVDMPSFEAVLTRSDDSQHICAEWVRNAQHYFAECIDQYVEYATYYYWQQSILPRIAPDEIAKKRVCSSAIQRKSGSLNSSVKCQTRGVLPRNRICFRKSTLKTIYTEREGVRVTTKCEYAHMYGLVSASLLKQNAHLQTARQIFTFASQLFFHCKFGIRLGIVVDFQKWTTVGFGIDQFTRSRAMEDHLSNKQCQLSPIDSRNEMSSESIHLALEITSGAVNIRMDLQQIENDLMYVWYPDVHSGTLNIIQRKANNVLIYEKDTISRIIFHVRKLRRSPKVNNVEQEQHCGDLVQKFESSDPQQDEITSCSSSSSITSSKGSQSSLHSSEHSEANPGHSSEDSQSSLHSSEDSEVTPGHSSEDSQSSLHSSEHSEVNPGHHS